MRNLRLRLKVMELLTFNISITKLGTGTPISYIRTIEGIAISAVKISKSSLISTDYLGNRGGSAKVSFVPTDELNSILIYDKANYLHYTSAAILRITGEIYNEDTGEVIFRGICGSLFDQDGFSKVISSFTIRDYSYVTIKYWLPYADTVFFGVHGNDEDTLPIDTVIYSYQSAIRTALASRYFRYVYDFELYEQYDDSSITSGIPVVDYTLSTLSDVLGGVTSGIDIIVNNSVNQYGNIVPDVAFWRRIVGFYHHIAENGDSLFTAINYNIKKTMSTDWDGNPLPVQFSESYKQKTIGVGNNGFAYIHSNQSFNKPYTASLDAQAVYDDLVSTNQRLIDIYYGPGTPLFSPGFFSNYNATISVAAGDWDLLYTGNLILGSGLAGFISFNKDTKSTAVMKALLVLNNIGMVSQSDRLSLISKAIVGTTDKILPEENTRSNRPYILVSDGFKDSFYDVFYNKEQLVPISVTFYEELFTRYTTRRNFKTS
jgi:hypothetical protein